MFIGELAFGDEPGRLAARVAHRELLAEPHRQGTVVMAGPLADDTGAVARGMGADPYYGHPAVGVVHRREWSPILP